MEQPEKQKIIDILKRRTYFDTFFLPIARCDARQDIPFRLSNSCPACGYLTLDSRCSHEICSFCFWEDDGQDSHDADQVSGGPNQDYSLTAYRLEFFDWMENLKNNKQTENQLEFIIGHELLKLDSFIINEESNKVIVLDQITLLSFYFDKIRGVDPSIKPAWNFLKRDEITKLKPPYVDLY